MKKLVVMVPCYNEEKGIGTVIDNIPYSNLKGLGYDVEVLVVDNNSKDRTSEVAKSKGVKVLFEKRQGKGYAIQKGFNESGFQTFNFDTTNSFGESDGDYEKSTLGLHWEDFEDVVKWAQEQPWFKKPMALTGHSKGGYAVARYAEEYPNEVDYIIPVAPVVSGELSFEAYRKRDPEELEKWKKEGVVVSTGKDGKTIKRKHWFQMEERLNHDLLLNAKNIKIPTLFIVGEKDQSCPAEHVRKLYDAISSQEKQIMLITGAPHSFYEEKEQKECTDAIKDWLAKLM